MPKCQFCKTTYPIGKEHLFDSKVYFSCRICGAVTLIKVRLHLSPVTVEGKAKIYRLGDSKEWWVLRCSIMRCWKCFKPLSREESEKIMIEKYSTPRSDYHEEKMV